MWLTRTEAGLWERQGRLQQHKIKNNIPVLRRVPFVSLFYLLLALFPLGKLQYLWICFLKVDINLLSGDVYHKNQMENNLQEVLQKLYIVSKRKAKIFTYGPKWSRGQMLKTRYKYKSLCGQSKTIIFLFFPGQLSPFSPQSSLQLSETLRGKGTCLKRYRKLIKYKGQHKGSRKAEFSNAAAESNGTFHVGNHVIQIQTSKIFLCYKTVILLLGIHQRKQWSWSI